MDVSMYKEDLFDVQPSSSGASTPSTSSASSQSSYVRRPTIKRKKVKASTSLMALDERRRKRKLSVKQKSKGILAAARFRKWKQKMDKKYDREIAIRHEHARKLRMENHSLKAARREFVDKCSSLSETVRSLTKFVEFTGQLAAAFNASDSFDLMSDFEDQMVPDFGF